MSTTKPRRQNSTTVRATPLAIRAARAGLRVASFGSTDLAARAAEHIFLTARRHPRPAWEQTILATAKRGRVPYGGSFLPTWTWTPTDAARTTSDANDASANGASNSAGETSPGDPAKAPLVILTHGWEGRGSQLGAFVEPLVSAGFRVVTFDGPGHGECALPRASIVEQARAVLAVARAHDNDVHAVVAHSVGGAATLHATSLGLSPRRLALIAPPHNPMEWTNGFAKMFRLSPEVKATMIARVEARYGIRFDALDACADAAAYEAPLLVVHDDGDAIVPAAAGQAIAANAPNGRFTKTTGLGHQRILRTADVIREVTDFVREGLTVPSFLRTLEGELFARDTRR